MYEKVKEMAKQLNAAKMELAKLVAERKAGEHGACRNIRRAEEVVRKAQEAYNQAYKAMMAEKATAWEAHKNEQKARKAENRKTKKDAEEASTWETNPKLNRAGRRQLRLRKPVRRPKTTEQLEEDKRRRAEAPRPGTAAWSAAAFLGIDVPKDVEELVKAKARWEAELNQCRDNVSALKKELKQLVLQAKHERAIRSELVKVYNKYHLGKLPINRELRHNLLLVKDALWLAEINQRVAYQNFGLYKAVVKEAFQSGNGAERALIAAMEERLRAHDEAKKDEEAEKIRRAAKVDKKDRTKSFKVSTFSGETISSFVAAQLKIILSWKPEFIEGTRTLTDESAKALETAKNALTELYAQIRARGSKPFEASRISATTNRLTETNISKAIGVDPDSDKPAGELVVIDHGFEEMISKINYMIFGDNIAEALNKAIALVKWFYRTLAYNGVTVDGQNYKFCFASASHQKREKAVLVLDRLMKKHERFFYFGKTQQDFFRTQEMTGASYLKAMANLARPINRLLPWAPWDVLMVKDRTKVYHHGKALQIGEGVSTKQEDGKTLPYLFGPTTTETVIGAGEMIALKPMVGAGGQCSGYGLKGFLHAAQSVIDYVCRKHGLTIEEFYDLQVEDVDGKLRRLGDYAVICSADCWKFDKFFSSWEEYLGTCRELSKTYKHVGHLSILRQSEDEEGEYKRRHMTRSFFQQMIWLDNGELDALVNPSVGKLQKNMKFETAFRKLAGLDKEPQDRTPVERLIKKAPFLVASPCVQNVWRKRFDTMMVDAMANRLDAKGQYPYIIQDPVALLECWVLGMSPDDPTIGVIKAGEISLEGVPSGKKVVGLRFPANYLTAKVLENVPYADIYQSCGNVAILSIYDDVLIRQDGDVDGDEMCILYNEIAVSLTERMNEEFDPPVIVFKHGGSAKKKTVANQREFAVLLADALYSASHNDHTGKYANLARDCAYLASLAYRAGDEGLFAIYMLWMAAASTGAIISIDQVKGNDISPELEDWLNAISEAVGKKMSHKQPWTQQFLKGIDANKCLPANRLVPTDRIGIEVRDRTGAYAYDGQGILWNSVAAKEALWEASGQMMVIQNHQLSEAIVNFIGNNLFADKYIIGEDGRKVVLDEEFRKAVQAGAEVSIGDLALYLYHNEMALCGKMEGQMLTDQRQEYYSECWKALVDFALNDVKPSRKGEKTPAIKKRSVYNWLLDEALELTKGNGVKDPDGKYGWFCLNVVAAAAGAVVDRNGFDMANFSEERREFAAPCTDEEYEQEVRECNDEFAPDETCFEAEPSDEAYTEFYSEMAPTKE